MSPRDRFQKLPNAKTFADTVGSDDFVKSLDLITLEVQRIVLDSGDPTSHAARLAGADLFRRTLETIATPDEVPHGTKPATLRHDAYDRPSR